MDKEFIKVLGKLTKSKARNATQYDNQKVIIKSNITNTNMGEIEIRTDNKGHYKQMKFRLKEQMVLMF